MPVYTNRFFLKKHLMKNSTKMGKGEANTIIINVNKSYKNLLIKNK